MQVNNIYGSILNLNSFGELIQFISKVHTIIPSFVTRKAGIYHLMKPIYENTCDVSY